ncbi:MAG TPA: D-alanyl-D-alanine carboxypeptidase, partial [Pyrinomonadaceae bacterium]|nr:D-alanyl-D-alanine carboxypeptidase [Pyrinomonadaceae bacterium]
MFKNSRSYLVYNFVRIILLVSLLQSAIPLSSAQQQPQRERRVASPGAKTNATPTPVPTVTPSSTITPADVPQPSPTPTPEVVQIRAAATTRTLAELQARIADVLRKPELSPAMIGIKVTSLETGKILFEENANKLLRPASNMKLYTVSAALDRLTPDYRFVTSVYALAKPDSDGVVKGDLIIYGRGDPSFAARFNNGDYFKGLNDLADRIAAAGVKRVKGDLVGDE